LNQRAISFWADSTASEPWQTLRPTSYERRRVSGYALILLGLNCSSGSTYNGVVTTDGARLGRKGVGGTEDDTASLDGVTALPDHGADGARGHVGNETGEERLAGEVGVVGLEVLLGGGDELDGSKLEAALLEALDDGADQAAL
jgi:hypothetical protein